MKGKLIKLELSEGYRLDDEKGNLIASTLDGAKTQLNLSKGHSDPKRNTQKDSIIERLESIRDRLKELKIS